jgi:biopolymer transport protein TolR
MSDINVTNLVDVILVLLVIFMITSPLMQMGVQVNLPKASASAIESKTNLTVTVKRDATLYVDDKLVPLTALPVELAEGLKSGKTGVLLRADKEVAYGAVMKVLDTARKAGIQDVGLVTELPEEAKKK